MSSDVYNTIGHTSENVKNTSLSRSEENKYKGEFDYVIGVDEAGRGIFGIYIVSAY
jgi:ribonuclease HIII